MQSEALVLLAFLPIFSSLGSYRPQLRPAAATHLACRAKVCANLGNDDPNSKQAREGALVNWLNSNGVWMSDKAGWGRAAHPLRVESDTVEDFELSGRGLLARKDVVQGEAIVQVPQKLLMTRRAAVEVLGKRIIPDGVGEYLAIALLLIHEREKGTSSFWAPYIGILPTADDVGQTWLWSEEDLALLGGSGVVAATNSLRAKLRREYDSLVSDVIRPNGLSIEVFSWAAFEWAMSMLFSRAIDLKEVGELALVPYADLLNHSPYTASYFYFNSIPFSKEREVTLYADRAYAKNDQLLISYGQKSNSELLLLYGFVIDRNLFDEVELTVSLDPSDARYDEKRAFLASQGLKTAMQFPLLIDRYSSELMQYLRLCCVTPAMGELASYKYNDKISPSNERAAYQTLREGCIAALASYPESEDDDRKMMENSKMFATLSFRQRQAIKLRRNEKRILLRTIKTCETGLAAIDAVLSGNQKPENTAVSFGW